MKEIRFNRMFYNQSICVLAVDHGLSYGQILGLELPTNLINQMYSIGCKNILLNKGMAFNIIREELPINVNFILNLSTGLNLKDLKTTKIVNTTLETAIKLDAVAVAVQINFNSKLCSENLKEIGKLVDEAYKWEIPVLAMVYIDDSCQVNIVDAVRIIEELGVDILKIARPKLNDEESILKNAKIPILMAGGVYNNDAQYCEYLREALCAGYKGFVIGRNIFQNTNPKNMMEKILDMTTVSTIMKHETVR